MIRKEYRTMTMECHDEDMGALLTREAVLGWRLVSAVPGIFNRVIGYKPIGVTLFLERDFDMTTAAPPGEQVAPGDIRADKAARLAKKQREHAKA